MLRVTCAIIQKDDLVLAVQRSHVMAMPLKWEFPGGKIEPGETEEFCLVREIKEELGLEIAVGKKLDPVIHDYGDFTIHLIPFLAEVLQGELQLDEHKDFRWLPIKHLRNLDWAAADLPIVAQVQNL